MLGAIVRFIVSALVLLLISLVIPGMKVAGFWGALIAALVIAALGWIIESMFGNKISPQRRGIVGFIVSAIVIYVSQYIVPASIHVTILGALIAALVIGVIDAFVPTELR